MVNPMARSELGEALLNPENKHSSVDFSFASQINLAF